jgi:hypothetical protein
METIVRIALGRFGQPHIRTFGHIFGNVDMAAFAFIPRDASGYEG